MVMINSPLRRTALAAVAALSLGTAAESAAARADAALSIALGALHAPLASMAQLQAQPQKPAAASAQAQVQGPTAPADVWKKVLVTARQGKYASQPLPTISLTDVLGDPKAQHTLHNMTLIVVPRADGSFGVFAAQFIVMETTPLPQAGSWRVDSWVFETDAAGRLKIAFHNTAVNLPGAAKPDAGTDENLDLADPKTKARYDAMLKHWAER